MGYTPPNKTADELGLLPQAAAPVPRHRPHWLVRAAEALSDHWIAGAVVAFPVLLVPATAVATSPEAATWVVEFFGLEAKHHVGLQHAAFWTMTLGAIAYVVLAGLHIRGQRSAASLDRAVIALRQALGEQEDLLGDERAAFLQDLRALVDGYLLMLARDAFGFGTGVAGRTDRITIYAHDDRDGTFTALGRFSYDPVLSSPGRARHSANQGCIGLAWRNGTHFAADFPDPVKERKRYVKRCQRDGVTREVVETIRMKSRLYYGRRIHDRSGDRPLAVVVVESTDPERWTEDWLDAMFSDASVRHYLSHLVERLAPRMPSATAAKQAGF